MLSFDAFAADKEKNLDAFWEINSSSSYEGDK